MMNVFRGKSGRFYLIFAALLVTAGLFAALAHHHHDSRELGQCKVCHFVKQVFALYFVSIVFITCFSYHEFVFPFEEKLSSLLYTFHLLSRAPPSFS